MPRPSKSGVSNEELLFEINSSKTGGEISPRLVELLMLLVTNMMKKMAYTNPMDRDDCYQGAMLKLLRKWHLFNETKSNNPFAFYSQIAKMAIAEEFNNLQEQKVRYKILPISRVAEDGKEHESI